MKLWVAVVVCFFAELVAAVVDNCSVVFLGAGLNGFLAVGRAFRCNVASWWPRKAKLYFVSCEPN